MNGLDAIWMGREKRKGFHLFLVSELKRHRITCENIKRMLIQLENELKMSQQEIINNYREAENFVKFSEEFKNEE